MNGQALIDFFEEIVEDSIEETAGLLLLNNAKDKVEGEREWEMLKAIDTSQSGNPGTKPLPDDFNRPVDGIIYVGAVPFIQSRFEQQALMAQSACRWYLDLRNSQYVLLGGSSSGAIVSFPYIYQTADVTAQTSPVWPERFQKLLAFEMAEIFFAIDQGERARSWDDKWALQAKLLKQSMIDWDVKLQRRAAENSIPLDGEMGTSLGDM